MHRKTPVLLTLIALVLAQNLRAQDPESPTEDLPQFPALVRKPSAKDLSTALDAVKANILPRIWDPKLAKDATARKQYLDKWQVVTSDHYAVFTNGPTASCKKYSVTLEDLYGVIKKDLPFEDVDHLLVAYIFADREDYYRFAERVTGYSTAMAKTTAGHAKAAYYATYYSAPRDAVVFHEAAHQIVAACLKVPGVGSWFQEGIAVYFENKMVNVKPDADAKSEIRRGEWYPLDQFFAIQSLLGDPAGHGTRNYDHAGSLVNFMINTKLPPVAGKFEAFLAEARKGYGFARGKEVSERLIKATYGLTVSEFESLWLEHLKVGKP